MRPLGLGIANAWLGVYCLDDSLRPICHHEQRKGSHSGPSLHLPLLPILQHWLECLGIHLSGK